ncbi:MAG: DUF3145 family protein [Leucobacter sp.]|jgi:hypothetical protein|nr:DUF3145 family protein [Leucobacter sp.]
MASATASARFESSNATGVFFVHSCPPALVAQVEWALAREIDQLVKPHWSPQPLQQGLLRATVDWCGPVGTAAAVASSLFGWQQLRFEITEDATAHSDSGRWMHTPTLGIFHLRTDAAGNGLLSEQTIRAAIAHTAARPDRLASALTRALGDAWDRELEPYRVAEEGDATIFELPRLGVG